MGDESGGSGPLPTREASSLAFLLSGSGGQDVGDPTERMGAAGTREGLARPGDRGCGGHADAAEIHRPTSLYGQACDLTALFLRGGTPEVFQEISVFNFTRHFPSSWRPGSSSGREPAARGLRSARRFPSAVYTQSSEQPCFFSEFTATGASSPVNCLSYPLPVSLLHSLI